MKWQLLHTEVDQDARITSTTEAMQLPHGCLVRTRVKSECGLMLFEARPVAVSMCFVPGAKVTPDGKFEHAL